MSGQSRPSADARNGDAPIRDDNDPDSPPLGGRPARQHGRATLQTGLQAARRYPLVLTTLFALVVDAAAARLGPSARLPRAHDVSELPGRGVSAIVVTERIEVGKAAVGTALPDHFAALVPGEMAIFVTADGALIGRIVLRDGVRDEAADVVSQVRGLGVQRLVMVTGDAQGTAAHVAAAVGVPEVHAGLLPAEKVVVIAGIADRPVIMVGDGVNDAPVLAAADVGVALGARGATAASQAADVVILVDDLRRVVSVMRIARRAVRVARQSIGIGIGLSVALMLVATWGVLPAIIGATLQEVIDVITILNSLRAHRQPRGYSDEA